MAKTAQKKSSKVVKFKKPTLSVDEKSFKNSSPEDVRDEVLSFGPILCAVLIEKVIEKAIKVYLRGISIGIV